jgi:hypothetical protein
LTVRNLEIADRLAADGYGTQATDSRTGKTVTTIRKEQAESDAEMDKRLKHEAEYQEELRKATGGVRSMLDAAQLSSSPELIRETIRAVAIETNRSFAGTRDKAGMSAAMNNQLGGMGLAVSYDKRTNRARYGIDQSLQDELKRMQSDQEYAAIAGQRLGTGTVDPKTEARLAAVESRFSQAENMAKELNRVKIDRQEIHLHVQNLNSRGDALNAARDLREAFQSELQKVE